MSPPKWNTQPSPERSSRLPAIWDRDLPPKRDSPPSSEAVTRFDDRAGPEWHRTGLAPRPGPRARECGCSGPCRSLGPTVAQRDAAKHLARGFEPRQAEAGQWHAPTRPSAPLPTFPVSPRIRPARRAEQAAEACPQGSVTTGPAIARRPWAACASGVCPVRLPRAGSGRSTRAGQARPGDWSRSLRRRA